MLDELRTSGGVSPATRRPSPTEPLRPRRRDAAIAAYLGRDEPFPETLALAFERNLELAYGENPHQRAAYYAERGSRVHLLSRIEQHHGKPLSFNNLNDLSAGRLLISEFDEPACVIVKHANPCGVAVGPTIGVAYDKALAADPAGLRRRRRAQPGRHRGARPAPRGPVRRGAVRARLRRAGAGGAGGQAGHADPG